MEDCSPVLPDYVCNRGRCYSASKLIFQHSPLNVALKYVSKGTTYPLLLMSPCTELLLFLTAVAAKRVHAEQRADMCLAGRPLAALKLCHKC